MEQKLKNNSYFLVDILKLFFAICVVGIHTNLFNDINSNLHYYTLNFLFRLAVPFFFFTSGFFFCKKIHICERSEVKQSYKKTLKRLSILLIFWLFISLPITVYNSYITTHSYLDTLLDIIKHFFFYPWGGLWYILALIVGYIIMYPFFMKNKYKLPLIIGVILYMFAAICNTYYFVIQNTPLQTLVDAYIRIFFSARNGVFVGFFYIAFSNYIQEKPLKKPLLVLIFGLLALTIEVIITKDRPCMDDHSIYISTLLIIPSLFQLAIHSNNKLNKFNTLGKEFRNLSIGIYLLHHPIRGYLNLFFKLQDKCNSILFFLIVLFLALMITVLLQKLNNKYINKIIE